MTENTEQNNDLNSDSSHEEAKSTAVVEAHVQASQKKNLLDVNITAIFKAISYRAYRLICECGGVIIAIAAVWLSGVNVLIAQRVVDISFLKDEAARSFAKAFDGQSADVRKMTLAWEAADNTIIFRANDISVNSKSGEQLNALTYVETELSLLDVARGKIDPIRVVIDGGELSFVRNLEGDFIAGLGTPETVGKFGPVWRGEKNDGDNDLEIGRIKSLKIDNAKIYILEESVDYAAQLSESRIGVEFQPDTIVFEMAANLSKDGGRNSASFSPLNFTGQVSPDLQVIDANFSSKELNPSKLFPSLPALKPILGLDAPLDVAIHIVANRVDGLQQLDVNLGAGKGKLTRGAVTNDFEFASVVGAYETASNTLKVSDLTLRSDVISGKGSAALSNLGRPAEGLLSKDTGFKLALDNVLFDGELVDVGPVEIKTINVNGHVNQFENEIVFDTLTADFGDFQPKFKGAFKRTQAGEPMALSLSGRIDGTVNREQLLSVWPKQSLLGARNWVKGSIVKATLSNLELELDIDEAVFSGEPMRDKNLSLTYDVNDGELKYISTMTPVSQAVGQGHLRGNSMTFALQTGRVADVIIKAGDVSIPRIYPFGGDLIINLEGEGPLNTMIGLLDQKPFEYVKAFGVSSNGFSGRGDVKLYFKRPLFDNITIDQVDFNVSGALDNVSTPFTFGKNKLDRGSVTVLANSKGLTVKGPVNIGPWQANLLWKEIFDNGKTPTIYALDGRLSQSDLDGFGFAMREFVGGGDILLSVNAEANGAVIMQANVKADLSDTEMRIDPYWNKLRGDEATITSTLSFNEAKQLKLENISLKAPGLDLEGALNIGADFKLQDLNFSRAKIDGFIDATGQIKPSPNKERFDIYVTGDYLDISPLVDSALMGGGGGGIDVPILLTGSIKDLVLNQDFILKDTNLLFAHNGVGVNEMRLKGQVDAEPIIVNLSTANDKALRTLDIDIPDASAAALAFFGIESIKGGHVILSADLPPVGVMGALTGSASVEGLKVVQAPLLTTVFSLGSLTALSNALNGEGINFETVEIPFSYDAGDLSLREARASGPGLGLTGNGEVSFGKGTLDLDGVLVPAYSTNSLLGSIPIIGDIVVGKKGEGIFALNYSITGPFSGAQVAVNPLSALTPGFLRGIFAKRRDKLPDQLRKQIEAVKPQAVVQENP